jgi:hypothetical protein
MQLYRLSGLSLFALGLTVGSLAVAAPALAAPVADSIAQASPDAQVPLEQSMPAIAEKFLTLSVQGDFTNAWQYLHPTLRENWSPTEMQTAWQDLQGRTGEFQQFLSYQQTDENVVLVNTQFANVTDDLIVIFDDSHQWIVGVDFPQS